MKITFIYSFQNERWSTPLSIANEFRSRGWEVEFVSINRGSGYQDTELKNWVSSNPKSDIVLFMDWGRFDSPYLDKNLVDAFWVQESGDDPQNFDRNYPKANRFHLTLTPAYDSYLEYKKRGINSLWWTHFADTKIAYPHPIPEKYVAVCSRGYGNMANDIDYLVNHYGENVIKNQNGWEAEEHSQFLCSGKMVLQQSRWKEITRRIFEAMACNKLVITDRLPQETNIDSLFVEGEDIIYYDSVEDLAHKISFYNENKKERDRIAKNAYNNVLTHHTQKQRVDTIIEQWKNYQLV